MLIIDDLGHTYPNGKRALDHVSLEVPKGMFGLLGPNGAGKSTLMRCLATLQTPTSGGIRFGDLDVLAQPQQLRQQLGYLPQDFGVYPRVSAYQLLEHLAILKGLTDRGSRRDQIEALLQQVNLWQVRKQAVAGFSGGMRQRFGIAQALLGQPRLIIVDEPTAGLDPEERHRFNNLLAEIGENVVVILSTHLVDDVQELCQRMAILAEGRLIASGEPRAMIAALAGRIWSCLIPRSEIAELQKTQTVISSRLRAGRTVVHVEADTCPGPGFIAVEPSLEDVYFSQLAHCRMSSSQSQPAHHA